MRYENKNGNVSTSWKKWSRKERKGTSKQREEES